MDPALAGGAGIDQEPARCLAGGRIDTGSDRPDAAPGGQDPNDVVGEARPPAHVHTDRGCGVGAVTRWRVGLAEDAAPNLYEGEERVGVDWPASLPSPWPRT